MILVIDNYDSFTYNLVQYLGVLDSAVKVFRNDEMSLDALIKQKPDKVVISPGPGRPEQTGIVPRVIVEYARQNIPVLGVCLGHQAIGYAFGAKIEKSKRLMHGKESTIIHDGKGIFSGLPLQITATRYHSLVISEDDFPQELEISARDERGEIMGVRHLSLPLIGVQFHPESVKTPHGFKMLTNFINQECDSDVKL